MSKILVEIALFERGWVTLEHKFQEEGGSSTNEFWAIMWCCLRDTFSRFDTIPACDTHRQTHTQTRDHGYYPRSARVKSGQLPA